jgi:CRISPR/Cas system CMR subunit Cmr4 (Cas7 group RAMP superfamily)
MLIGQAFLLDLPVRTYDEMFIEVTARYKEGPT